MDNLLGSVSADKATFHAFQGPNARGRIGEIACEDIGYAAAEVLRHPDAHYSKCYYLSVESASMPEVAVLLGKELGTRPPTVVALSPADLDNAALPYCAKLEAAYKDCVKRCIPLFDSGVITDADEVTGDTAQLLAPAGRTPLTIARFLHKYASDLVEGGGNQQGGATVAATAAATSTSKSGAGVGQSKQQAAAGQQPQQPQQQAAGQGRAQ